MSSQLALPIKLGAAKDEARENVLLVGPPSTGKTTQFLTLPGRKFLYVFDPNCLQSLAPYAAGQDIEYVPFIADIQEVDISIKTLKKDVFDKAGTRVKIEPTLYVDFERDLTERLDTGFFKDFDWIGLDGMTTFSNIVMDRVQYLNKRLGKHPEQADYTAQMNTIKNVFRAFTGSGCHTCTMCHIQVMRDDTTGKTNGQLVLTGRLRTQIPLLFSQIFGMDADASKQEAKYTAQTVQDKDWPTCRSNIQGLKVVEDVTLDFKKDLVGQGIGGILLKAGRVAPNE